MKKWSSLEFRVAFTYLIVGVLWIFFSDMILAVLVADTDLMTHIQNYKGWFFVAASSLLIYFLVQSHLHARQIAEQKEEESTRRLRMAMEASQQGIFDFNIQSGELVVDDAYYRLLGYDPQGVFVETRDSFLQSIHPDDVENYLQVFREYMDGRSDIFRIEFRHRTANGNWRWFLSMGKIVKYDADHKPMRMLGTFLDITEKKDADLEIERLLHESQNRLQRLETLRAVDQSINENEPLSATLKLLTQKIKEHLKVDAVGIYILENTFHRYELAVADGFIPVSIQKLQTLKMRFPETDDELKVLRQINPDSKLLWPELAALLKEEGFQDFLVVPLIMQGSAMKGVLVLFSREKFSVDDEWLLYNETLAGQMAIAIANAKLIDGLKRANVELEEAYDRTIEGWSKALDLRDKETKGHSSRVMQMTMDLAQILGISEEELIHIRRGALLHDMGKMGIPDSILLKPAKLTEEEFDMIRKHPQFAFDMLNPIVYLRPALDIPYSHHEKWDGTGYPQGLSGEMIPIAARLFAVVDVYDALTSHRPYREPWSHEKTMEYIHSMSGSHFDPQIVAVFEAYMQKKGQDAF